MKIFSSLDFLGDIKFQGYYINFCSCLGREMIEIILVMMFLSCLLY